MGGSKEVVRTRSVPLALTPFLVLMRFAFLFAPAQVRSWPPRGLTGVGISAAGTVALLLLLFLLGSTCRFVAARAEHADKRDGAAGPHAARGQPGLWDGCDSVENNEHVLISVPGTTTKGTPSTTTTTTSATLATICGPGMLDEYCNC